MPAAVYARYSSHRQGEQSIEGQFAEAKIFAAAHGLTIVKEYADRAMTGRNDNREQFQQMLRDSASGLFDALIVWKTDRIGRNKEDIAYNKYMLKKHGVKIYYIAEVIPDTPEGVILESVIEGMAAYYSEQLSQNIRRGQRASAAKAQSTGGNRPLGYRTGADKRFEIDPETAPTVRMIFELYAQGYTCAEIITKLNRQGRTTLRGGAFNKSSIHRLLTNEKYVGVYVYKDEIRIEDGVPRLIDDETFLKVQGRLKINKRAPAHKWTRADYLLTDKLFCGQCGGGMVGVSGRSKTGKKYNYYYCATQRKHLCGKKPVRQAWIERLVIDHAKRIVFDDALIEIIAEQTYRYYVEQNTDTTYTDSLRAELKAAETSIGNILKAIEAGIFSITLKERLEALEARKQMLTAALKSAQLKQGLALTQERILYFLLRFREIDYEDPEAQKRLIATFINAVFVYDDKVVISFNYSGDDRTITLSEVDAGISPKSSTAVSLAPPTATEANSVYIIRNVFVLIVRTLSR